MNANLLVNPKFRFVNKTGLRLKAAVTADGLKWDGRSHIPRDRLIGEESEITVTIEMCEDQGVMQDYLKTPIFVDLPPEKPHVP